MLIINGAEIGLKIRTMILYNKPPQAKIKKTCNLYESRPKMCVFVNFINSILFKQNSPPPSHIHRIALFNGGKMCAVF